VVNELTAEAARLQAGLLLELEKDVGRADEPVLVHGVELDAAPVAEDHRAADQGDVVEVDHVEALRVQDLPGLPALEERKAGLLRGEGGECAYPTDEAVTGHTGLVGIPRRHRAPGQRPVAIDTVDDVDFVPASRQHITQPVNEDGVPAKGVRG